MPPDNPRIVPPNKRLLGATVDNRRPILNEPSQLPDPYREGSTAEAPSLTTPYGSPIEPPVTTGRRLTIYYQNQGGANGFIQSSPPVAPEIDQGIDIAKPLLNQFAEYAEDRSQVNSIPIVGRPVQKAGFGKSQDLQQKKYTDSLPEVAKVEFNTNPTIVNGLDTNLIDTTVVTPDPLGVYNYDRRAPRKFRINDYQNGINTGPTGNEEHKSNVDRMLYETRGHNERLPFVTNDSTLPPKDKDKKISLGSYFYKELGSFASGSYVRAKASTNPNPAFSSMTIDQMKNIGLNIMFEAAQGQAGFDFTIRNDNSSATAEAEARMALPSEQRLGKRVSLGRFTPAYQIKKLTGVEKPSNPSFIDNTDDIQTYGSFYNVYNQFDALVPVGQIALCVALILAFTSSLSLLAAILKPQGTATAQNFVGLTSEEKAQLKGTAVLRGDVFPSSANAGVGAFFTELLGTNRTFDYTRHTWEKCLSAGIQEFFGFSFNPTGVLAGQQAINTSFKVLTESGRLNVILRELLRSGITLVEGGLYDPSQLASISGTGNLIEKIRNFKIVRFINVLISIGDKINFEIDLRQAAEKNVNLGGGGYLASGSISYVDSLPDSRPFYVSKSRLTGIGGNGGLAWSNKTAGMMLLPLFLNDPKSFGKAGLNNSGNTRWSNLNMTLRGVGNGQEELGNLGTIDQIRDARQSAVRNDRWSSSVVKQVEDFLEADYMPFYLHDLRTNEILAFHAFLEDANEDFGIEYSAQDGYGRMDKVQIYKSTTRNISVNFKMVATNEDDHDLMWYKINRLAMMIYPQWTQGRKISAGDLNFIQPLSQIPGATPVIRLRLGDLYKSNYSKMAVARLFGITTLEDYNDQGRIRASNNTIQTQPQQSEERLDRISARGPSPVAPINPSEGIVSSLTLQGTYWNIDRLRTSNLNFGKVNGEPPNSRRQNRRNASVSLGTMTPSRCFNPGDTIVLYPITGTADIILGTRLRTTSGPRIPLENYAHGGSGIARGRVYVRYVSSNDGTGIVKVVPYGYSFEDNYIIPLVRDDNLDTLGAAQGRDRLILTRRQGRTSESLQNYDDFTNGEFPIPYEILNRIVDRELTADLMERKLREDNNREREQEQVEAEAPGAAAAAFGTAGINAENAARQRVAEQNQAAINAITTGDFYNQDKNPVMKAFKSNGGKGLAGVITNFKVDYGEAKGSWGIDGGLRAPKFVSVQLTMAVIHDITPGLDAKGIMNAPIWPVGRRSNFFMNNGPETNPSQGNDSPQVGQPATDDVPQASYFNAEGNALYINRKG